MKIDSNLILVGGIVLAVVIALVLKKYKCKKKDAVTE